MSIAKTLITEMVIIFGRIGQFLKRVTIRNTSDQVKFMQQESSRGRHTVFFSKGGAHNTTKTNIVMISDFMRYLEERPIKLKI